MLNKNHFVFLSVHEMMFSAVLMALTKALLPAGTSESLLAIELVVDAGICRVAAAGAIEVLTITERKLF